MTFPFNLLLAADPALGRFNHDCLPDQILMEMLIEHTSDAFKMYIREIDGSYRPVQKWKIATCLEDGTVDKVWIRDGHGEGSLQLAYLPRRCTELLIMKNGLTGKIDAQRLPATLKRLCVTNAVIGGTVDFTQLPHGMTFCKLTFAFFEGTINLKSLPPHMQTLSLHKNYFSGSVTLDYLPGTLVHLDLSMNALAGKLSFDKLPQSLRELLLYKNQFVGEFCMKIFYENLVNVDASFNAFSKNAKVNAKMRGVVNLELNPIEEIKYV